MKFSDAYWEIEEKIITVDEISDVYKNATGTYHSQYENHLFCPECNQAQLVYINGPIPYLRSYPNSNHSSDCFLRQSILSVHLSTRLINSTNTGDQEYIQRQIQSVLARISRNSLVIKHTKPNSSVPQGLHNKSTVISNKAVIQTKRLMQKNLYSQITEDEYEVPIISYGIVRVTWEQHYDTKKNAFQYHLLLWKVKEAKRTDSNLICKILISPKVYLHIPENYKSLKNEECYVTLFSVFKNYHKKYKVTYLRYAQYLKILSKSSSV